MIKRLPSLNALKAFEAAARHLSFTKAAEELFVTQAAVSHQIKTLEDFFGFPLFSRKNRTIELTELGKNYFFDVQNLLQKLAIVTDNLKQLNQQKTLSINLPQTFGTQWLVPRLSEFNQLYPEINVKINGLANDEEGLSEDTDIAIYYGKGNWRGLKAERLSEDRLLILASPKLLAEKPILQPKDLAQHTLLHVHSRDNWRQVLAYLEVEKDLQHSPLFSHTFMALQAAIHKQGVILANQILAVQEIDNGNLVEVLHLEIKDPKAFYLVYRQNRKNDPTLIAFRDWIFNTIKTKRHLS
ncbi:transcriptional regulator [Mergibacter septicus]|uniref:transcriptional regulator GcvA n=1 Tax=Mergibacter septicus TaxID=221402 RepID=UPI0011797C22|nr:transcriptional regulator GcvA [Mergibacter septicus]AWX13704.1 transcriptional regulator [Mergibacter septicus]